MALSDLAAVAIAADLVGDLDRALASNGSKGRVKRYLAGDHDLPYIPKSANQEYRTLAKRSVTNWLPLITDTFAKALWVDGYRPARAADNAPPWAYWQANGLDARQSIAHRGALEYGTAYALVLPGDPAPLIRPLPPVRTHAVYADPDDEWPQFAVVTDGRASDDARLVRLFDAEAVYTLARPKDSDAWQLASTEEHGLGVTPLVRFRDRLGDDATGIVAPLITLQDRINESVFALMIALQYASFRQRWATGLAIPTDEDGVPVEPFEAAVDRLWVTDNPEAKFGDFAQTAVDGHLATYQSAVRSMAAIGQTPPHVLLGDLVNLSADALAAAEASTQRKSGEYETLFGEAWEQALRLAALADGDEESAQDTEAQVRWRDTEARSMAQTVDALGKMVQMLGVPPEATWTRIPGVTDQDVEAWRGMAASGDGLTALAEALGRQTQTAVAPETPTPTA